MSLNELEAASTSRPARQDGVLPSPAPRSRLGLVDVFARETGENRLVELPHQDVAEASQILRPAFRVPDLAFHEWPEVREAPRAAGQWWRLICFV